MLVAIDDNGHICDAETSEPGRYFCPECGDELVHRIGQYITSNFAHPADPLGTCALRSDPGESYEHQSAKETLTVAFRETGYTVEVETTVHDDWTTRRPDLAVHSANGQWVAIEVQHSTISAQEKNDRNADHRSLGATGTIWVWIRAPKLHISGNGTADLQAPVYDEWRRTQVCQHLYGRSIVDTPNGPAARLALRLLALSRRDDVGKFQPDLRCGIEFIPALPKIVICRDLHGNPTPRLMAAPPRQELAEFVGTFPSALDVPA